MAELKTNQAEMLLSREQLREVERFQAKFAELELQLHHCVDDFLSILNRHYFNRENGFIDEQQGNLREIVTVQNKLETLAAGLAAGSKELKTRMLELQGNLQGQSAAKPAAEKPKQESAETQPEATPPGQQEAGEAKPQPEGPEAAEAKPDEPQPEKQEKADAEAETEKPAAPAVAPGPGAKGLIDSEGKSLADSSESGGEISLRLIFDGLRLTDPSNAEALGEISNAMRKLLYDRKLVGYSKTSLVFGKNRTVGEVLEDLTPIFLSPSLQELMEVYSLIEPGEGAGLVLACNPQRELIYINKK